MKNIINISLVLMFILTMVGCQKEIILPVNRSGDDIGINLIGDDAVTDPDEDEDFEDKIDGVTDPDEDEDFDGITDSESH
jgi:hypothetical protein